MTSEPNSFMSCGEDGTVRFFDLRIASKCNRQHCRDNILVFSPTSVTSGNYKLRYFEAQARLCQLSRFSIIFLFFLCECFSGHFAYLTKLPCCWLLRFHQSLR